MYQVVIRHNFKLYFSVSAVLSLERCDHYARVNDYIYYSSTLRNAGLNTCLCKQFKRVVYVIILAVEIRRKIIENERETTLAHHSKRKPPKIDAQDCSCTSQ